MKRLFYIVLFAAAALSLGACGHKKACDTGKSCCAEAACCYK